MSRLSSNTVEKRSDMWQKNIKKKVTRRPEIPLQLTKLDELCKMPLKKDVVGRFLGLYEERKEKKERINMITRELIDLWDKLNFPVLSVQCIHSKISEVIDAYVIYRKKKNTKFEDNLTSVFDVTKSDGNWLSSEDKKLYEMQIESQGTIRYTTAKLAPILSIHPSKRKKKLNQGWKLT